MLDKKDIARIVKVFESYDTQRENLIKASRDVIKASKQLIYALHRDDKASAKKLKEKITKSYKAMQTISAKHEQLNSVGPCRIAVQEYVEALCYYGYVVENKIPNSTTLDVDPKLYILGLCDLTGELVRKAINDAIHGNTASAFKIKQLVEEIYGQLLLFDFRQSEFRKSFDRIKYDLRRLEDVALDLKIKNA